jgi:hypothetical protein
MLFRPTPDPLGDAFDVFWRACPRREGGKLEAEKQYRLALSYASPEAILAGIEAYKAHMPSERQYQVTPGKFLSRGMYLDEYEPVVVKAVFRECDHEPRCGNKRWCEALRLKAERLKAEVG